MAKCLLHHRGQKASQLSLKQVEVQKNLPSKYRSKVQFYKPDSLGERFKVEQIYFILKEISFHFSDVLVHFLMVHILRSIFLYLFFIYLWHICKLSTVCAAPVDV